MLLSGSSGAMVTIPADRALPISANDLDGPPDLMTLYERIGGAVERVPHFTCYEHADLSPYEHVGTLVRCIVLRNRPTKELKTHGCDHCYASDVSGFTSLAMSSAAQC